MKRFRQILKTLLMFGSGLVILMTGSTRANIVSVSLLDSTVCDTPAGYYQRFFEIETQGGDELRLTAPTQIASFPVTQSVDVYSVPIASDLTSVTVSISLYQNDSIISTWTIFNPTSSCQPQVNLPAVFEEFSVSTDDYYLTANVAYKTSSEINVDRFDLYYNGIFKSSLESQGIDGGNYSQTFFVDKNRTEHIVVLYTIDIDGDTTSVFTSPFRVISEDKGECSARQVNVFYDQSGRRTCFATFYDLPRNKVFIFYCREQNEWHQIKKQ